MLVYGDPIMISRSKTCGDFKANLKKAEKQFQNGSKDAYTSFCECLSFYGLSLPVTFLDKAISTSWQVIRMILHQVYIGQWLSSKTGGLFCTKNDRKDALNSAKELAIIYHRLNQINLTMNIQDYNGLMLSLHASNLAETASTLIEPQLMIEIYITTALRIKKAFPKILQFLCRYYLLKARNIAHGSPDNGLIWVFSPYGHRFIASQIFTYTDLENKNSLMTSKVKKTDPILYVLRVNNFLFFFYFEESKLQVTFQSFYFVY